MRRFIFGLLAGLAWLAVAAPMLPAKPNVILILADDLGYGDLGCYGQTKIRTPNLDQLAKDGMRFTQCYAGSTVCAPSRCTLMTGLHTGHCRTRGNGGGGGPRSNVPLAPGDLCVAEVFQKAGYATALVGKWGLGEEGSTGIPTKKGFQTFYGYLNQHHAHNYYPPYLIRNEKRQPIPENVQRTDKENVAEKPVTYAPDLLLKEALAFLDANKDRPFFLEFATIAPHANNEKTQFDKNGNEVPSNEPYAKEDWPIQEKNKAAMITRMDADIGKLLAKLKELKLDEKTLILFSSDNGPHREGGNDPEFFKSSGPFSGIKRSLTDGGIRVPGLARWTGTIKPGTVSDHLWAFWDFLPTACDLVGEKIPAGLDGISLAPTLTGKGEQKAHEYLYWEFHEGGSRQAIRTGDWKGIRAVGEPLRLYDLKADPTEKTDVAAANPEMAKKIQQWMETGRTESKEFPLRAAKKK